MNRLFYGYSAKLCIITALSLTVIGGPSAHSQTPDLKVTLSAKRVAVEQGKETLTTADKAKPGEIIQYEAAYHNNGQTTVERIGAVVPIPAGLTLVADSARPTASEASLDGKNFGPVPLMRPVKNEAGIVEDRPVPLTEYRALRWTLDQVAPGATTTVTVRARVGSNGTAK
jgi:uncharacterized repeat protein (TIGR01451 family)